MKRGPSEALFTPDVCREIFRYLPDVKDKLCLAAVCKWTHAASQDPVCWQSCDLGDSADDLGTLRLLVRRISSVQQLSGTTEQLTQQWQGAWMCFTNLQELSWKAHYAGFCTPDWATMTNCLPDSIQRASLILDWGLLLDNDTRPFQFACLHTHGFAPILTDLAVVTKTLCPSDAGIVCLTAGDFGMLKKLKISAHRIFGSLSASQLTSIDLALFTHSLDWEDHLSEIKTLVHIHVELSHESRTHLLFSTCESDLFRNVQSISLKADRIHEGHAFSSICADRLVRLEFQVTMLHGTTWDLDRLQKADGLTWHHHIWDGVLTVSASAKTKTYTQLV